MVAALLAFTACNSIFGVDDLSYVEGTAAVGGSTATGSGGLGGSNATSSSTTATGGLGGGGNASGGAGGVAGMGGGGGAGGEGGNILTDPFCDARFSALPLYQLCAAPASNCKFFRQVIGSNCEETCRLAGVTCLDQDDQTAGMVCTDLVDLACTDNFNDVICTCSRNCGAGSACGGNSQCVSGSCN